MRFWSCRGSGIGERGGMGGLRRFGLVRRILVGMVRGVFFFLGFRFCFLGGKMANGWGFLGRKNWNIPK